jgi:4'-phosphopantetheinyl transferase
MALLTSTPQATMESATLHAHGPALWTLQVPAPRTNLRDTARDLVREALQAHLPTLLSCVQVSIVSAPGEPPRLAAPHEGIGLSIAHESGLSLVAIHAQGPVGVDVMQVIAMPDALDVALAYLGPEAAQALAERPADQIDRAFAQAWTAHEARLKCLGMQLEEWHEGLDALLNACSLLALPLPAPWVAHLAWH